MVSIDWESPDKYKTIVKGKVPIKCTTDDDFLYKCDIVNYHKENSLFYQLGIVMPDTTPSLEHIEDEHPTTELFKISGNLWILKGEWKIGASGKGYHYCPSINSQGKIRIYFDREDMSSEVEIDVNTSIEDFNFSVLKNDFEGDLWNLITKKSSRVRNEQKTVSWFNKNFYYPQSHHVITFLQAFEKVLKNPKRELQPTVKDLPFRKVKPVPATFKKLATTGITPHLPSKAFVENFDIYENRFLCLMLYRVYQIVSNNDKYLSLQVKRLHEKVEEIKQKIEELKKPQVVDRNKIEREMTYQQNFYNNWLEKFKQRRQEVLEQCENHGCGVTAVIEVQYKADSHSYWVKWQGKKPSYGLMEFPVDMTGVLEPNKRQRIQLKAFCFVDRYSTAGRHPKFLVQRIERIVSLNIVHRNILDKQIANYEKLKENNWLLSSIQPVNSAERDSQIKTLNRTIETINLQATNLSQYCDEIQQFKPILQSYLSTEFATGISYKRHINFKPSMTYIQNVSYRNALNSYKTILDSEGIDFEIFGQYEKIISYGMREMPQVFEIWCFLQIISSLERFGFKYNEEDFGKFLKSITPDKYKIDKHSQIRLLGNLNGREVTLHYQMSLSNGKRPDFVLEINVNGKITYLVLDAKFKNYNYKMSVGYEIRALADKYKIGSNYHVFILHPCSDKAHEGFTSILTNFGGDKIQLKDDKVLYPFHEYGYLKITPNIKDNLHKVIGMAFEYLVDDNHNAKSSKNTDPAPSIEMCCLNCGSENFEYLAKRRTRLGKGNPRYYYPSCTCKDCGHTAHLDYCWNCQTKLFKHGSYWDYHRTSMWSIFDIHCPSCGMTVADMPST